MDLVTCRRCGKREPLLYPPRINLKLAKARLCYECWYWTDKVRRKRNRKIARIAGRHYYIADENAERIEGREHAGSPYRIRFFDGREVETTNLWSQGVIPTPYRKLLPDNAVFVNEGCAVPLRKEF